MKTPLIALFLLVAAVLWGLFLRSDKNPATTSAADSPAAPPSPIASNSELIPETAPDSETDEEAKEFLDDLLDQLPDNAPDRQLLYMGTTVVSVEGLYIDENPETGVAIVYGFSQLELDDGRKIMVVGEDATLYMDPEKGMQIHADDISMKGFGSALTSNPK